jgi:hypothetical protein
MPPLPTELLPLYHGVHTDENGVLLATREYRHGVLEISPLDPGTPQDALVAKELSLLSSN